MNRRGFVKALAALPAVVGGLISIPRSVASPDRVAHPADAAGDLIETMGPDGTITITLKIEDNLSEQLERGRV